MQINLHSKLQAKLRQRLTTLRATAFLLPLAILLFGQILLAGPTIAEQQAVQPDSPMVVFIHSQNCATCAKVRPIYNELEKEWHDKIQFVSLDVSDESTRKESKKLAKTLGIGGFLSFYEDQFPCIGIFKTHKKPMKELYGLKSKEEYVSCIQKALESK